MDKELLKHIRTYKKGRNMDLRSEAKWLDRFYELVRFKQIHDHANVPSNAKEFQELSHWVANQRKMYKLKSIDPAKIELLEHVGFKFSLKITWYSMFKKLVSFKKKYGHANPTIDYTEKQLYAWLLLQRKHFKKGELGKEKISQLTNIGFVLKPREIIWDENIEKLKAFKKLHGHLQVCAAYKEDTQLFNFVRRIRYQKSKLSQDKITRLERMGFVWRNDKNIVIKGRWLLKYEQLKEFRKLYGHCQVPVKNKEYHSLSIWANKQMYDKDLSEEKRGLLDHLGFFENKRDSVWHKKVDQLVEFKKKNGHLYLNKTDSPQLYNFVKHIRHIKLKLSVEQTIRLNQIGFLWDLKSNPKPKSKGHQKINNKIWLKRYEQLKAYKEIHGNLRVSQYNKAYRGLANWISTQRSENRNLSDEQLGLLEEIGFFDKKMKSKLKLQHLLK